jgi:hypothetical protein
MLPEELPCVPLLELLAPVELVPPEALDLPAPCEAFHSSRLSLPSWSLSSWSKDWLCELDDELPPAAALFDDDGLAVLLCDMDGCDLELLFCFAVSLA